MIVVRKIMIVVSQSRHLNIFECFSKPRWCSSSEYCPKLYLILAKAFDRNSRTFHIFLKCASFMKT